MRSLFIEVSKAERAVCAQVQMSLGAFLGQKYVHSGAYKRNRLEFTDGLAVCAMGFGGRRPHRGTELSEGELAVCRQIGVRPEDYVRSKMGKSGVAVAAAVTPDTIPARDSLIDAHKEIDRAHAAMGGEWRDTPILRLISAAIKGFGALPSADDDANTYADSYNKFLIGVTDAVRAMQLASPDPDADKLHAPSSQGLIRAHNEIDRAHAAALSQDEGGAWRDVPMNEMVGAAAAGLQAYRPGDDGTYDDLLMGVLNAVRALKLVMPAYANRKPLPGEK